MSRKDYQNHLPKTDGHRKAIRGIAFREDKPMHEVGHELIETGLKTKKRKKVK